MNIRDIETIINTNPLGGIDAIVEELNGDIKWKEKLITLSKSTNAETLHGLIEIAFELEPFWSIENLSSLLYNEDEEVRVNFCAKLGFHKYPESRSLIENLLSREKSDGVRCVAVMCLGEVGNLDTISILQNIIKNDSSRDYEGRLISDLAEDSVMRIRRRFTEEYKLVK